MMFNPAVTASGSDRLRNVWRVESPSGPSAFTQLPHITEPFEGYYTPRSPQFEGTLRELCSGIMTSEPLHSV
jgi:hypothetical protein